MSRPTVVDVVDALDHTDALAHILVLLGQLSPDECIEPKAVYWLGCQLHKISKTLRAHCDSAS